MVTLTGTFTRLDGDPATGTVRVTPSRTPIMDPDGGVIISGPQTFPLDAEGKISVTLPATDDPSLGEAFTYSVITNMTHANWQIRGLELPSSMSTVDLSNPPSGIVREYPTRAEWEAIIDPVVAGAEVAANRAEDAADAAWSAVDTPGRQGPPGEVTTEALTTALAGKVTGTGMTVRHDTSVGTRVLLDHPGGTVTLAYNSGWRALCRWTDGEVTEGTLPTGLTPRGSTSGGIFIRRLLDTVTIAIVEADVTQDSPMIDLQTGFRGVRGPFPAIPIFYRDSTRAPQTANAEFGTTFVRFRDVPAGATLSAAGSGGYGVMATAPADPTLPTSLPGTPL